MRTIKCILFIKGGISRWKVLNIRLWFAKYVGKWLNWIWLISIVTIVSRFRNWIIIWGSIERIWYRNWSRWIWPKEIWNTNIRICCNLINYILEGNWTETNRNWNRNWNRNRNRNYMEIDLRMIGFIREQSLRIVMNRIITNQ